MGDFGTTVIGVDEVIALFKEVENVSQSVVTKAAKAGVNVARKYAKSDAPKGETKKLVTSIKPKAEKRKKGKKVYDLGFVGEGLVKISKEGKRSFYPVSQEYGWMTKKGKKIIPPKAGYLRGSIDHHRPEINEKVLSTMADELKKVK